MNEKELVTVSGLTPEKRYEYFIKKVADYEEVWSLYKDGWVLSQDEFGNKLFPIWPKEEFAKLWAVSELSKFELKAIDLYEFIENLAPLLKKDGIKFDVFSNNESSILRDIDDLLRDLNEELENY